MLRQLQLRWGGHLVRMGYKRLPKRLLYGNIATGSRRQGCKIRRYKDTLKSALKCLQISPANWGDLARDRPTWRRAIYETNRIAAAKAKREAHKTQLRPPRNANAQPPQECPRRQRIFRVPIGLVGHLRINCIARTSSAVAPPSTSSSSSTLSTNSDRPLELLLPFSSSSSSAAPTAAVVALATPTPTTHNPVTATNTNTTTVDTSGEDLDYTCPHCDRTFTSHIGLVGYVRIPRTDTGKPVPEASTYTRRIRLHCPHCTRTFMHRVGLFGSMCIHENLR
ncbi:hypothetical protein SprV_0301104900 [Sparganum proliferum]